LAAAGDRSLLSAVTLATFAAAIAVAILKYRLYDIDWILHRTLVYGLLTAVLGVGYAGAVVVVGEVLGEHRSTLAVAAATIDHFSVRLREQIDLDTLTGELLAVVDQTMEPTRASLWLRPPVATADQRTRRRRRQDPPRPEPG
jgi:hypothetical protein